MTDEQPQTVTETPKPPEAPKATVVGANPGSSRPQGGFGRPQGGFGGSRGQRGPGGQGGFGGGRGGPGGGRRGDRRGDKKESSEFEEEVIQIDRVTRVVKGGRRLRFRATVVIGNKKGKVGIGIGKSTEVATAIQKAIVQAKKHMYVMTIKNGTIPHELLYKYKRAYLKLLPAAPGTGLKAGGSVRKVLEMAGVKNVLSKMMGCRNKLTNAQATFNAIKLFKSYETTHDKK